MVKKTWLSSKMDARPAPMFSLIANIKKSMLQESAKLTSRSLVKGIFGFFKKKIMGREAPKNLNAIIMVGGKWAFEINLQESGQSPQITATRIAKAICEKDMILALYGMRPLESKEYFLKSEGRGQLLCDNCTLYSMPNKIHGSSHIGTFCLNHIHESIELVSLWQCL